MKDWLDVFSDEDKKEIELFLKSKMKSCGEEVQEMEYALHKIVGYSVYDYRLDELL